MMTLWLVTKACEEWNRSPESYPLYPDMMEQAVAEHLYKAVCKKACEIELDDDAYDDYEEHEEDE
jgi:hypothetical protein